MNHPSFTTPALETMNGLLPAFEFTAVIAANDLGAVYVAKQRTLERDVAIKVLAPHVSAEPKFRESFEATARTMGRLNHPNLIGVFDSGFVAGMLYFVMEFVPGKSLAHSASGQRVEISQALRLMEGICDGLAHAHAHGIIHGNLNPSNVLLNQKAEPKISNFGFTHPVEISDESGSPADVSPFIAPEVMSRAAEAGQSSDIYAAGAVLYELVTAQPHGPDAQPPSAIAGCAAGLDAVWHRATHPDPGQRFPDMRTFRMALTGLQETSNAQAAGGPPDSQRLGVRSAPPVARPPAQMPVVGKRAGNRPDLIRNLVIVAGLVIAMAFIWNNLEKQHAREAVERRAAAAKAASEKEQAEALKNAAEPEKRPTPPPTPPVRPEPVPSHETPGMSLARLRGALASGDRTELPAGSVRQGENDYFLVSESMTWPEAAWFAEQHGGHLAIPSVAADLTWLIGNVSEGKAIWIGAARNGPRTWALADGSPWIPKKEPGGGGTYLALDKLGLLIADSASASHPFIIQWHRDGTNPGKIETLLAATKASLTQAAPVFPPGTQVIGNRRYLFIARPMTWPEAIAFAEKSGGHPAVASEAAESTQLSAMADGFTAPDGIWLGGSRKDGQWVWITGEPWKTAKWATYASMDAADSALIIRPGKGWDVRSLSSPASGLIIEWSNDRNLKPATPAGSPGTDVAVLTTKARELIVAADHKRTEKLAANVRKVGWDLDIVLRNLPKSDQSVWGPQIERLKNSAANNRVPDSIPKSSGIQMTARMAQIAQDGAKQQDQIDADFLAEAEKIRTAFTTKIRDSVAQAEQAGQRSVAISLRDVIDSASNLAGWVRSLGVEPNPANPKTAASQGESPARPGNGTTPGNGDNNEVPPVE